MAVNNQNVLVGKPDQDVTGAILSAPLGTDLPAATDDILDPLFTDSGYVGEDGVTLAQDRSTNEIRDWSGSLVRRVLETFDGTLAWPHLEVNEQSLKNTFGDDAVTAANGQITVAIGGHEMPRKSWVFRMKDGDRHMILVVPDGQVTDQDDISFVAGEPILLPVTLSCYPDARGNSIYWILDDGSVGSGSGSGESE